MFSALCQWDQTCDLTLISSLSELREQTGLVAALCCHKGQSGVFFLQMNWATSQRPWRSRQWQGDMGYHSPAAVPRLPPGDTNTPPTQAHLLLVGRKLGPK